jgi:hypothetical protein
MNYGFHFQSDKPFPSAWQYVARLYHFKVIKIARWISEPYAIISDELFHTFSHLARGVAERERENCAVAPNGGVRTQQNEYFKQKGGNARAT